MPKQTQNTGSFSDTKSDPSCDPPWITASDIAAATYCPYQLYLKNSSTKPDRQSRKKAKAGIRAHQVYNRSQAKNMPSKKTKLLAYALLLIAILLLFKLW